MRECVLVRFGVSDSSNCFREVRTRYKIHQQQQQHDYADDCDEDDDDNYYY